MISDDLWKSILDHATTVVSLGIVQWALLRRSGKSTRKHIDSGNEKVVDQTVEKVKEKVQETIRESMALRLGTPPALPRVVIADAPESLRDVARG